MSETTYIEEADVHVCNNCGAHSASIDTINHYPACKKGESKKWEKFYSKNNDEEVKQHV